MVALPQVELLRGGYTCPTDKAQLELLRGDSDSTGAAPWWLYLNLSCSVVALRQLELTLPQLELLHGGSTSTRAAPWLLYINFSCSVVVLPELKLLHGGCTST